MPGLLDCQAQERTIEAVDSAFVQELRPHIGGGPETGRRMTQAHMLSDVGADFAEWTAPIISDRALEFYGNFLNRELVGGAPEAHHEADRLASRHCRIWLCLLRGREKEALACRRDLLRQAHRFGLERAQIDGIDREIIDELMDIVIGRFGRSRVAAHTYGMALVTAATSLAEARLAA